MIRYKVAFVLRMIDDFSGMSIIGKKFSFQVDGVSYKPIEKLEGLYIFLEPIKESAVIEIKAVEYNTCEVVVNKQSLDPSEPIAEVRLYAKAGRDLPYRYELVSGKLDENKVHYPIEVVTMREKETGIVLKEVKKVGSVNFLVCNGFTKESLVGKTYAMDSGKTIDVFILTEKTGINEYMIEGQLKGKHIAGTPIKRCYRSVTDEMGYYAIPVPVGETDATTKVVALKKG